MDKLEGKTRQFSEKLRKISGDAIAEVSNDTENTGMMEKIMLDAGKIWERKSKAMKWCRRSEKLEYKFKKLEDKMLKLERLSREQMKTLDDESFGKFVNGQILAEKCSFIFLNHAKLLEFSVAFN